MERYVIGIDEVGRGPLAGPVAVGIAVMEKGEYEKLQESEKFWKGKDSKKLTEKRRKESFEKMKALKEQGILRYGVFFESNATIDRVGISGAIRMAIAKGLKQLMAGDLGEEPDSGTKTDDSPQRHSVSTTVTAGLRVRPEDCRVLLDGGLKVSDEFISQRSIVRGDESELIISLASIAAKVTRDAKMEEAAEAVPHYDLKNNKGYGTAKHIADLKQYGPCELHRRSFIRRLIG